MNKSNEYCLNQYNCDKNNELDAETYVQYQKSSESFRQNLLKRLGIKYDKFVQPERSIDELYKPGISIGPKFSRLIKQNSLINVSGGDDSFILLESFKDCQFGSIIDNNLLEKNILQPTLIQKCVIPIILSKPKYDLMAQAETGSGKTAAFLLPIIQYILILKSSGRVLKHGDGPFGIIIAPTRELTQQLGDTARALSRGLPINVVTTYGETNVYKTKLQIQKNCDILCSTPGRAITFSQSGDINLQNLIFLVLDEADKLLDNQFYNQIDNFLNNLKKVNSRYRTLLFSATFDTYIKNLVDEILRPNYFCAFIDSNNVIADTVKQFFVQAQANDKFDILYNILSRTSQGKYTDKNELEWKRVEKVLVFCNSRRKTNYLALKLSLRSIKSTCTNGNLTQQQRCDAKEAFEKGDCDVLISTNVMARGLNIVGINHIINYDLPTDFKDYVHRVGRTGRIGNIGRSTSFIDLKNIDDCRVAKQLVHYLNQQGQSVPDFLKIFN